MADETTVIDAPASGGGGALSSDAGGGSGGGAPSAPAAPQTDEQILGMDPIGTAPAEEPAPVPDAEKPPVDDAAKAAADAGKTPEQLAAEKIAEDGRLMPVKWREMAKQDPEFRTLFYTAKANQEKLATMEPKFAEMQTAVTAMEQADQSYLSGDPVAIQGTLKSFVADKPDALIPMYEAGEQLLKELHPEKYAEMNTARVQSTLKDWKFDQAFAVLRNAIDAKDDALLKQQVEQILKFADGNGFPTTDKARVEARARELDRREAEGQQQAERSYTQTAVSFKEHVNTEVTKTIEGEIQTAIGKLLEKTAFADGAKKRIATDARQEIYKLLEAKPEIVQQIQAAVWPNGGKDAAGKPIRGIFNDANRALAIKLPVEYAKTVLNDVLTKVVNSYTTDFMASHQTVEKKKAAAASRTEVSGGSPAPQGRKPLGKKDVDYGKMSDDDILNA